MWIIYKEDGRVVSVLYQTGLANIWGIHPFLYDISLSDDEATLNFSCDKDGTTYKFSVDLLTGLVSQLSESV